MLIKKITKHAENVIFNMKYIEILVFDFDIVKIIHVYSKRPKSYGFHV